MCCTSSPSVMSNTILYCGKAERNGKLVHVLAYQNVAESDGPNAMILPFPTNVPMGPDNVINTKSFSKFLKNITDASKKIRISKGSRRSDTLLRSFSEAQVFDVGSYSVILAENVSQIPEAIKKISEKKRPTITEEFLSGYENLYPNQPIAICCWEGAVEAEPLLWWYEPRDPNIFFIPTMDAHDGNAPKLNTMVYTDHIISVGSSKNEKPNCSLNEVKYEDSIPQDAMSLLPKYVNGGRLGSYLTNGDIFVNASIEKDPWAEAPFWYRGANSADLVEEGSLNGWE